MQPVTPEHTTQPNAETQPNSPERLEVQQNQAPAEPIVVPALPAQPLLPNPAPATSNQPVGDVSVASTALAASDDGLIEKEWVDKAKKIIAQTKNDPYTQEKEVSKLQAEYIKKRYGKDIKLPS